MGLGGGAGAGGGGGGVPAGEGGDPQGVGLGPGGALGVPPGMGVGVPPGGPPELMWPGAVNPTGLGGVNHGGVAGLPPTSQGFPGGALPGFSGLTDPLVGAGGDGAMPMSSTGAAGAMMQTEVATVAAAFGGPEAPFNGGYLSHGIMDYHGQLGGVSNRPERSHRRLWHSDTLAVALGENFHDDTGSEVTHGNADPRNDKQLIKMFMSNAPEAGALGINGAIRERRAAPGGTSAGPAGSKEKGAAGKESVASEGPGGATGGSKVAGASPAKGSLHETDERKARRMLANRQSAQRSRMRKLMYISELEKQVSTAVQQQNVLRAGLGQEREYHQAGEKRHADMVRALEQGRQRLSEIDAAIAVLREQVRAARAAKGLPLEHTST